MRIAGSVETSENYIKPAVQRFYSLDVLRGIAALGVVVYHWQHFFYSGTKLGPMSVEKFPFFKVLSIFYMKGWLAVDLFFSLSGFIFYWLYAKAVAEGTVTPRDFAVLRFSRLYPLHIVTLLGVAAGQMVFLNIAGTYFVYPYNDSVHFLLNLLFASSWGLERGDSFNGPIWSVSVEVLVYAVFFVFCRKLPLRFGTLLSAALIGFLAASWLYSPVGRGIGSFFLGGCMFLAYQKIVASGDIWRVSSRLPYATAAAWIATWFVFRAVDTHFLAFSSVPILWRVGPHVQWLAAKVADNDMISWPAVLLFPLTILTLALIEYRRGSFGKRISFLGDISYSTYLLHFPLQLAVVTITTWLAIDTSIFYSGWFMLSFFLALILAGLVSYHYLELPAQRFFRQKGLADERSRPVNTTLP